MNNDGRPKNSELQLQIQHTLIESLSASERRSAGLLNMLQEIVFECDFECRFTYLNSAWKLLLGLSINACIGSSIFDYVVDAGDRERLQELFDDTASRERRLGIDSVEIRVGPTELHAHWFILRLRRQADGFVGTMFDITDRRRSEILLHQQALESRRLAFVASATDNIVIITDHKARIEWVNQSFEEVTGYTADEVIGRQPGQFLQGPKSDPAVIAEMSRAISNNDGFNVEIVNYTKSGEPYLVEIEAKPIFDDDGRLTQFVAIESDVTDRRKAEAAIKAKERKYRHVVDNVSDVILRADLDGCITFLNPAWERMTGRKVDDCIGAHAISFVFPDDRGAVANQMEIAARNASEENRVQCRITDVEDNPIWVEALVSPILSEEDGTTVVGFAGTLSNIEERRATSEALRLAKSAAEELAEQKTRFLANMSHEIRTPLNAVIGMSELLQQAVLNDEQSEYVRIIQQSGKALLDLVNDVLHFSKLEAGSAMLESAPFSIGQVLESAVDIVAPQLNQKPVSIVLSVDPAVPEQIVGDQSHLRQVILNLLGNAAKFTSKGRILVSVGGQPAGGNGFELQVAVSDTGPGIPKNRHATLFDVFTQADSSTTRRYGGSGLGLSICKQICEMAGGSIAVESQPGKGSTFSFTYPVIPGDPTIQHCHPVDKAALQACVLGDDLPLEEAVSFALQRCGIAVSRLSDVTNGVAGADASNLLVVATGPAWLARARDIFAGWHERGQRLFIIVVELSAVSAQPIERQGDTIFVRGPFKTWSFLDGCRRYLAPAISGMEAYPDDVPGKSEPGLKILAAEDNHANQLVIRGILESLGHTVDIVANGLLACRAIEDRQYDLVFMDLQMPTMDGFRATRRIRGRAGVDPQLPIIAITADALDGDRERCLEAGMNDYLTKPVTRQALDEAIRRAVPGRETSKKTQVQESPMATGTFPHEIAAVGRLYLADLLESYASARQLDAGDESRALLDEIGLCLRQLDERLPELGLSALQPGGPGDVAFVRDALKRLESAG